MPMVDILCCIIMIRKALYMFSTDMFFLNIFDSQFVESEDMKPRHGVASCTNVLSWLPNKNWPSHC
jgi:hypothetical protein